MSIIEVYPSEIYRPSQTAVCLVCGGYQFEDSTIINHNIPYICDRCRAALLKVVESEDGK